MADGSFNQLHRREQDGVASWTFGNIAIATCMNEIFGPVGFSEVTARSAIEVNGLHGAPGPRAGPDWAHGEPRGNQAG
jgi:hypothetical protein